MAALAGSYDIDRQVQPSGKNAVIYSTAAPESDFVFEAATGTITGYTGHAAYLEIPATIGGKPVLSIGEKAFAHNANLAYLVLPEGIESLGNSAFYWCNGLKVVEFPTTLKAIGDSAFAGCTLAIVNWAEGLETIGAYTFEGLAIKEVLLPSTVKTIDEGAFKGGSIEHIRIDNAIETIGAQAFADNALDYVELLTDRMIQMDDTAFEGNTYDTGIDLRWNISYELFEEYEKIFSHIYPGSTWVYIGDPIGDPSLNLEYPADGSDSYTFDVWETYNGDQPHLQSWYSWDGMAITTLGDGLFKGNQTIRSWYPSHSFAFHHVGKEAFADSSVEVVDLCYSVETIGEAAFRNCVNIKEITLPETLKTIAVNAFDGCTGLEKITILCDASVIPEGLLEGCTAVKEITAGPEATEEENRWMYFAIYGMPEVTITQQPVDVTVYEGEIASATVAVEGESVTYAWYEGKDGSFRLNESATDSTYTLAMTAENNGLQVYCVVTDAYGTAATSETATLRMRTPLTIAEQPANVTTPVGDTVKLTVKATGDGLTYQWYIEGTAIAGANAETVSFAMTADHAGTKVHCVVTDIYGESLTSNEAALFLPTELVITAQPQSAELPEGEMTAITVKATGDGLTYQWYVMPSDRGDYVLAEGFTDSVYAVVVDAHSDWSSVYCVVTDAYGNTVTSETASIFIARDVVEMPEGSVDPALVGHWVAARAEIEGMVIEQDQLAAFGVTFALELNADGSAVLIEDGDEMGGVRWLVAEGVLYLDDGEDVITLIVAEDGTLNLEGIVLVKEGVAAPVAVAEPAPAATVDTGDRLEKKYLCKTFSSMGQTMDATMLGGEFSLCFHGDGTVDFVASGVPLPNLTWKQSKVTTDDGETDAYVIDYYGTIYEAILTAEGFEMDYFGSMLLSFVPAE